MATRHLRRGEVIVNATEGVFGLACRALDRDACAALAALKHRGPAKPFIVVAAEFAQIERLLDVAAIDLEPVTASWPGPETWILPTSRDAPVWLAPNRRTIAVRLTNHPQFAGLARRAGPLVSTSANPPGRPPALNLLTARRYFGHRVSYYLPGKLQRPGIPSRIRDGRSGVAVRG